MEEQKWKKNKFRMEKGMNMKNKKFITFYYETNEKSLLLSTLPPPPHPPLLIIYCLTFCLFVFVLFLILFSVTHQKTIFFLFRILILILRRKRKTFLFYWQPTLSFSLSSSVVYFCCQLFFFKLKFFLTTPTINLFILYSSHYLIEFVFVVFWLSL